MEQQRKFLNNFIGSRLKTIREEKNLTTEIVAEYLEINESLVCEYESGVKMIPIAIIMQIINGFNLELDEIIKIKGTVF